LQYNISIYSILADRAYGMIKATAKSCNTAYSIVAKRN